MKVTFVVAALSTVWVALLAARIVEKYRTHWRRECFFAADNFVCPTCEAPIGQRCHTVGRAVHPRISRLKQITQLHWSRVKLARGNAGDPPVNKKYWMGVDYGAEMGGGSRAYTSDTPDGPWTEVTL